LKARARVERFERLFSLKYTDSSTLSPKTIGKASVRYEYHYQTWNWIWKNCDDEQFTTIKTKAQKRFGKEAKHIFCSSLADLFLGASNLIHIPKEILGMKVDSATLIEALKEFQDIEGNTLDCVKLLWDVPF
jgi:hypothetical protein